MTRKILESAESLYRTHGDPSRISFTSVMETADIGNTMMKGFLKERYRQRRAKIFEEYNLLPPFMALLREEVIGCIPFLRERRKWKNFIPSDDDWARYVRLPIRIGPRVAELLGMFYWDYSGIYEGPTDTSNLHHYYLELSSQARNTGFYSSYVKRMIKRIFDIDVNVETDKGFPRVRIGSKALVTWLLNDLSFPNLELPHSVMPFYFDGQIAVGGNIMYFGGLRLDNQTPERVQGIKQLGETLGFHPSRHRGGKYVYFPKADFARMRTINLYHSK